MPIDDHDIKIFAKLLETNTFLESLDLSQNNNITDVGCQELINLYRSNKNNTLQEIKLDNNPFISEENYNTLKRLVSICNIFIIYYLFNFFFFNLIINLDG